MIKIDNDTAAKVAEYKIFGEVLDTLAKQLDDGEDCREAYEQGIEAFITLQKELVAEFLPFVNLLAEAGLLTVAAEGIKDLGEHDSAAWKASHVFANGNIWIEATGDWHTGWRSA